VKQQYFQKFLEDTALVDNLEAVFTKLEKFKFTYMEYPNKKNTVKIDPQYRRISQEWLNANLMLFEPIEIKFPFIEKSKSISFYEIFKCIDEGRSDEIEKLLKKYEHTDIKEVDDKVEQEISFNDFFYYTKSPDGKYLYHAFP
jgi:hypothetical protein